jgi:hypothetical protein
MVGVTSTTAELEKQRGRNQMHSKLQQKYVSLKYHGKNILLPRAGNTGTIAKLEKVYGVCLKHTKMLSTDPLCQLRKHLSLKAS